MATVLMLAGGGQARAQLPNDRVAQARYHFQAGQGLYHLGSYRAAIEQFAAGYRLVPRPEFLLNLGQSHRMLKDLREAREYFVRFLDEAPKSHPSRGEVESLIAELDRTSPPPEAPAMAPAAQRAAEPPAVESHTTAPPLPSPATVAPAPSSLPPPIVAPVRREPRRRVSRGLVWGLIGGSIALVASGVALGVVLGTAATHDPAPTRGVFTVGP